MTDAKVKVSAQVAKSLKKNGALQKEFNKAAQMAVQDPARVEKKKGVGEVYSLRLRDGKRVLMEKGQDGDFVPFFIGSHDQYMEKLGNGRPASGWFTKTVTIPLAANLNKLGKLIGLQGGQSSSPSPDPG